MAGNSADQGRSVTAKLAAILTEFNRGSCHQLSDLALHAGLPMSTAHRLVHELTDQELLSRDPDGNFRHGPVLDQFIYDLPSEPTLQERGPLVVADLVEVLRRPVRLGVLDELEISYIEKSPGYTPVTSFGPAARLPLHATALGKALLAFAPTKTLRLATSGCLAAHTRHTLTRTDQLLDALHTVRHNGFATNHGELTTDGRAIAVPVLNPSTFAYAAIEVDVETITPDTIEEVLPALRLAAHALNRELHPHTHQRGTGQYQQPFSTEQSEFAIG
jgi:DNA-binding IclR family transcriptional regulator